MNLRETTQYEEQRDKVEYQIARDAEHVCVKAELLAALRFVREQYQSQIEGIPVRLAHKRTRVINSIIIVSIMIGVLVLLVIMYDKISYITRVPPLVGLVLGIPAWPFTFVMIVQGIANVRAYCVHLEKSFCMDYIERKKIFTLPEEKRYCTRKIIETDRLIQELSELPEGESYKKFAEWKYEERRADEKV